MRNKFLSIAALALVSFGAQAQVTGVLGGDSGDYATFSAPAGCTLALPCTLTGTSNSATIVGGTVYGSDQPFADIPKVTVGNFLASGPSSTDPSTMTFAQELGSIGFLWGSPDTYNTLTVLTNLGSYIFTTAVLGIIPSDGNQSFSQYVTFNAADGTNILGLVFTSNGTDAFEVSNFGRLETRQVTSVPEPETYALMLAGLAAIGFLRRRRTAQV